MIPLLLGVTIVTFVLFHAVGGNPCFQFVGRHADQESLANCNSELGFDRPPVEQYLRYLKDTATFNFGRSFATRQKVTEIITEGVGPSLALTAPAFVFGNLLALAIALVVALYRGRWLDRLAVFACILGMSVTVLAYILLGQYFLAYRWQLFPISGFEGGIAVLSYLALPVLIWVVVGLGYDVRFFRTVLLDEIYQDYVRTARSKGVGAVRLLFVHVLKNAMIPIITHVVIQIPFLITGSLLLENFFQIPGLGNLVVVAIQNSDFPVLKAMVFVGSLSFIAFNLLSDVLYAWVDPRIRYQRRET
jgi:peptide/nickel transport system permease protein